MLVRLAIDISYAGDIEQGLRDVGITRFGFVEVDDPVTDVAETIRDGSANRLLNASLVAVLVLWLLGAPASVVVAKAILPAKVRSSCAVRAARVTPGTREKLVSLSVFASSVTAAVLSAISQTGQALASFTWMLWPVLLPVFAIPNAMVVALGRAEDEPGRQPFAKSIVVPQLRR